MIGRGGGLKDLSGTRTRRVATKAVDFTNMTGPNHDAWWLLRLHRHHSFGGSELRQDLASSCRTCVPTHRYVRTTAFDVPFMLQTPRKAYHLSPSLSYTVVYILLYGPVKVQILGWRWSPVLCAGVRYSTNAQDTALHHTLTFWNCLHLQLSPKSRLS